MSDHPTPDSRFPTPDSRLPPSDRDFEIYDAIHIDGSSTRDQAKQHEISQTRVRQVVRRVVEWLGEVLPPQTKVAKEQQTHLARQIAADRFQRQFEQVNSLWTATLESKYASIRIRLTTAQARLGVVGGIIDGLAADAIEGLPVPVWQAPAEPAASQSEICNPKSAIPPNPLFPSSELLKKGPRALEKAMPRVLWDPLYEHEITPEIVAARAAWGYPISPEWIKRLQDQGKYPRDDDPAESEVGRGSPDPAAPQAAISNLQSPISNTHSPIPSPPPLRDCSPKNENAPNLATPPSPPPVETLDTNSTCDDNTASQNLPANGPNSPAQPLLTTPQTQPVTQLQLTPHQAGVTISPIAANNSVQPQNSQVASNSGG